MNEQIEKAAIEYFSAYFAQNYYGTVVFSDPRWHAPRIFRAAKWAIQQATKDAGDTKSWTCSHGSKHASPIAVALCGCERPTQETPADDRSPCCGRSGGLHHDMCPDQPL